MWTLSRLLLAFALTAVAAWVVQHAIRRRVSQVLWLSLVVVLGCWVLLDEGWRNGGFHGLFHTAIVVQLAERGAPLEHPLLAGWPMHYNHGLHAILCAAMRVLPLAPPWLFVAANVVLLVLTALALDAIASSLGGSLRRRRLGVILALVGTSFLLGRPLFGIWRWLEISADARSMPIAKFFNINANPAGIAAYAWALWGAVQTVRGRRRGAVVLALSLWLTAVLYPVTWPAVAAVIGTVLALSWWRGHRDPVVYALVAIAVAGSVPSLLATLPEGGSGSFGQALHLAHLARSAFHLVLTGGPLLALVLSGGGIRRGLGLGRVEAQLLAACAVVTAALHFLHLPLHTEYKFLALAQLPFGILAARALESHWRRSPRIACGWLALLLLPAVAGPVALVGWPMADPTTTHGRQLLATDPDEAALYAWIRASTAPDAMFIDSKLTIPTLAGRSLFIGLDDRRSSGALGGQHDGWGMTAETLLETIERAPIDRLERRRAVARGLLAPDLEACDPAWWPRLDAERQGRDLFVVWRDRSTRPRDCDRLQPAYSGSHVDVLRLVSDQS